MGFYSSNFYDGDPGEYYTTPYSTNYDIVPFQDSLSYSSYDYDEPRFVKYSSTDYDEPSYAYDPFPTQSAEFNYSTYSFTEPKLIEYNPIPTAYSDSYDSFPTQSEFNYSTYSFTEPKLIEYNPIPYETQYAISYSTTTAVDDTEFEEYDTTPYGGGYDPTLTYGKPLAPSDEICYPRSLPESDGKSPDNFSYRSIPSPYGIDDIDEDSTKPRNGSTPTKSAEEHEKQPNAGTEDNGFDHGHDSSPGEQGEGYTYGEYDPWSAYGSMYGCDKQVPQTPYGSGLEAMDLCESLFGYWPCLCKNYRKNCGHQGMTSEGGSHGNQWVGAADYLFGSPYAHGGDEAGRYGDPTYNYERHY